MRNDTLLGLSLVFSVAIIYTLREVLSDTASSSSIAWFVRSPLIFVLTGSVVMVILFPINKKILKWRKERGRDIEEEQKYETEDGFISLTRRDEKD